MGKNRHSKDKLYIVAAEYARDWGGYKKREGGVPLQCLPFDCCGLTLRPFVKPVCTEEGIVFDERSIFNYIDRYHRNPVTGKPLKRKDLITVQFHRNSDNKYHCPVTYKEFTEHTCIVANRKSGHVYSREAVDALCRKGGSWTDPLTDEPFIPTDLIVIQDPHNVEQRNVRAFDYVKTGKDVPCGTEAEAGSLDPVVKRSELTVDILERAKEGAAERCKKHNELIPNVHCQKDTATETESAVKHELFTTHRQAASFTSTALDASYKTEFRSLTDAEVRQKLYLEIKKRKEKGYVRLVTSLGVLNLQLHCDLAPETCHNFLQHCSNGYYNEVIFHRSIPRFMIQSGDPTGTGKGGKSSFQNGACFKDEFHSQLTHVGPGILSMANSGPNTNTSQFFITYASCEHLNRKHTVFGRVVGGMDTLTKMEALPTVEKTDRPKHPPKILEAVVFKSPFDDYIKEREQELTKKKQEESQPQLTQGELLDPMRDHKKRHISEVGKYTAAPHREPLSSRHLEPLSSRHPEPLSSRHPEPLSSRYDGTKSEGVVVVKRPANVMLAEALKKKTKSAFGSFSSW